VVTAEFASALGGDFQQFLAVGRDMTQPGESAVLAGLAF